MGKESPFRKQTDDLLSYNKQLKNNNDLFKRLDVGPKALKTEIQRLSAELLKLIDNQTKATKPASWNKIQEQINRTKAQLDLLNKKYDETLNKQNKVGQSSGKGGSGGGLGFLTTFSGAFGALGIGYGAKEIITDIVKIRAETEKLGKQIEISLGDKNAGAAAQRLIRDFANKTPLQVDEVTRSFNRLVGIGIVPTEKQLYQLSDVATANGKTIIDYVEAIADAGQNEYERLKEFGIRAKTSGDQVTFMFRGQATTVANTKAAINDYLISLGNVAGVQGQTEEAGKLLDGRYSTLKDTFKEIANDVGILVQPALEKLLDVTQQAALGLSGYVKDLQGVAQNKGLFRAFFQSVFDPHGFNVEATEAQFEAFDRLAAKAEKNTRRLNRRRRAEGKGELFSDDPLIQQQQIRSEQAEEGEAARKAQIARDKAEKEAKKAADKQKQIDLDLLREAQKQVTERKKLEEDLQKLQADYDKQRLEQLDKGSEEYIQLKRKLDLAEIEQARKHLIEVGQLATGTPYYNAKTQRVEVEKNAKYKLPSATEYLFQSQRDAVNTNSQVASFEASEANSRASFERQQYLDSATLQRKFNESKLELENKLIDEEENLRRKAGESELDFERRKQQALLKIRLDFAEKQFALIKDDPTQKEQAAALRRTIVETKNSLNLLSSQSKEGAKDLFDLLGITFDRNAEKNDQVKAAVSDAVQTVVEGGQQILAQQLQSDQARIDSIDRQLQAKQREVDVELELSRQGLANNLGLRRAEESALQAERKKAIEAQRTDHAIQLGLNAVLQGSQMALATAKIIANSAEFGPLAPVVAGISIAGILALFGSTIAQISQLPKYHDGDEVTHETARRRRIVDQIRPDEVDARLQVGEGVIRKDAYQPNKKLFSRINKLGRGIRASDLESLLEGTGVGLPTALPSGDLLLIQQHNESRQQGPDRELHRRVDGLADKLDTLIEETRGGNRAKREQLPDGRIRETDASGNVTVYRHT